MKNILIFIFCLLGLSAFGQPQGVSMRSTNGAAFGATTHFRAASNYFAGPARIAGAITASGATNRFESGLFAPNLYLGESGVPGTLQITSSENTDETVTVDSTGFQFSDPVNAASFIGSGSQLTGLPGTGPFTNTTTYGSVGATNTIIIGPNGMVGTNTSAAAQGFTLSKGGFTNASIQTATLYASGASRINGQLSMGTGGNLIGAPASRTYDIGAFSSSIALAGTAGAGAGFVIEPGTTIAGSAAAVALAYDAANGGLRIAKVSSGSPTTGLSNLLAGNLTAALIVTGTNGFLLNSNSWTAIPTLAEGQVHLVSSNGTPYVVRKYAGTQSTNAILAAAGSGAFTGNPNQFAIYNSQTNIREGAFVTNMVNYIDTNDNQFIWVNVNDLNDPGTLGGLLIGTAGNYTLITPGNLGSFRVQGEVGANTLIVTNNAVVSGTLTVNGGASPNSTFNGDVLANAYYSPTNANNTGSYVAGGSYFTNVAGNITLGPIASIPSGFWSTTVAVKNTSGTDRTVTMPAGVVDNANNASPGVVFATNGFTVVFQITGYGSSFTNLLSPH